MTSRHQNQHLVRFIYKLLQTNFPILLFFGIFPAHADHPLPNTCVGNNLLARTRAHKVPVCGQHREIRVPCSLWDGAVLDKVRRNLIFASEGSATFKAALQFLRLPSRLLRDESRYFLLKQNKVQKKWPYTKTVPPKTNLHSVLGEKVLSKRKTCF